MDRQGFGRQEAGRRRQSRSGERQGAERSGRLEGRPARQIGTCRMRVSCVECALRAWGLFKPVSLNELTVINDIKRDPLALPAGSAILRAGHDCADLYTLYSG